MSRSHYHHLINEIDDFLLSTPPQKGYTVELGQMVTQSLKKVLLEEYDDHWTVIRFYKTKMYLSTLPLDRFKVLSHKELSVLLNANGRRDPMSYFSGRVSKFGAKKRAAK